MPQNREYAGGDRVRRSPRSSQSPAPSPVARRQAILSPRYCPPGGGSGSAERSRRVTSRIRYCLIRPEAAAGPRSEVEGRGHRAGQARTEEAVVNASPCCAPKVMSNLCATLDGGVSSTARREEPAPACGRARQPVRSSVVRGARGIRRAAPLPPPVWSGPSPAAHPSATASITVTARRLSSCGRPWSRRRGVGVCPARRPHGRASATVRPVAPIPSGLSPGPRIGRRAAQARLCCRATEQSIGGGPVVSLGETARDLGRRQVAGVHRLLKSF